MPKPTLVEVILYSGRSVKALGALSSRIQDGWERAAMTDPISFMRNRIKEALGDMSFATAAQRSDGRLSKSTLHSWVIGKTIPGIDGLIEIAAITGRDLSFFLPAADQKKTSRLIVQKLDVCAAAGAGAVNHGSEPTDLLELPSWIAGKLGRNANKLKFLTAKGESMEPMIRDGALLLVNERIGFESVPSKKPKGHMMPNDIFVFTQEDEVRVKRLRKDKSGLILAISEHPAYDPEILRKQDFKIEGRVVWWDNWV